MKVLLASPSPRDINDFKKAMLKLPHDIYMAKYYPQLQAYLRIRRFFLNRSEYDILAIIPDDLIVDNKGLSFLINDMEKYPNTVVSGYCNFDAATYKNRFNFRREGSLLWPEKDNLIEYMSKAIEVYPHLYLVDFAGFGCTLIPRNVVEQIPLIENPNHAAIDELFCNNCRKHGIDVLVDIRARFNHLAYRVVYGEFEKIKVGVKKPKELFIPRL